MAGIDDARIQRLNEHPADSAGRYVLYWMQQSQRADSNPALEHAVREAEERNQPVVVGFGLTADYPDANARHYAFLLQGLAHVQDRLRDRGIKLVVRRGSPDQVALELAADASLVVCDRGYLRHQRAWRRRVAEEAGRAVVQVEGDVVVPIEVVSQKREYAARTLRPKIERVRDGFLTSLTEADPTKSSLRLRVTGDVDPSDPERLLRALEVDREVAPVESFVGGTDEARRRLTRFLRSGIGGYAENRSEPAAEQVSGLSPYLHFGQISPVEVALKARASKSAGREDLATFLEELVVRRELSANYVYFAEDYDRYGALPEWARKTLEKHKEDARPARYTRDELEAGKTHDRYWNAAMAEMRETGYLHNTLRMYWGKQIIQWTNTPGYAFDTALYLNNRYFLDGRDPNSFTNIAWLFGLHDRPWQERDVLGTVRTMTRGGLDRKYDMDAWMAQVEERSGPVGPDAPTA
ncbi:MAG: deoxyribodipyrimidine photo-lyase [Gemmatimonadetes bacterium]|nr:deoxyribodipyrimidine photo-lyase [Gemmatimonadota bacterium]